MSGSASLGLEQAMLGHTLGFATLPVTTTVFVALCMMAPAAEEGISGVELAGGGYVRTPATFALVNAAATVAANTASIEFPIATADWGTAGYFELWDAQTGGNRLYWGQLIDPVTGDPMTVTVHSGDIARFSAGTLTVLAASVVGGSISIGGYLPLSGGTMTGPVVLPGNATLPLQAVPLQQLGAAAAVANVKSYGAVGNGTANDTTAIRTAIATGQTVYFPTGTYLVTDALNLTTMGQRVYGDGISNTVISITALFTMSAAGVFSMNANHGNTTDSFYNAGPSINDLTISFAQVDTAVKANLIHFPPAIFITNTQRWRVERICVKCGWDGIYAYADTTGGSGSGMQYSVGGGYIEDVQLGCLNTNVYIDGAGDTTRITGIHIFPFGQTASQQTIFFNPASTTGVALYRCDDFKISNGLFLCGLGVYMRVSANGTPYGLISNCDFDTYSGVKVDNGGVNISNAIFLVSAGCVGLALGQGANVNLSSASFSAQALTSSMITVFTLPGGLNRLTMSDFTMDLQAFDIHAIDINSNSTPGTANVTLSNGFIAHDGATGYSAAVVLCQSTTATLSMSNVQITPKTAGAGVFIQVTGGANHRFVGNSSPGWTNVGVPMQDDYANMYQQTGGAADLNVVPAPWSGFGFRNYEATTSQANWPTHSGGHIAVLDTYTANPSWPVQMTFGFNTDGIWHRWGNGGGGWSPWYQVVTSFGGMAMAGSLGLAGVGFNGTAPIAKPAVTGSRGTATATVLGNLITALSNYGLITDNTTA